MFRTFLEFIVLIALLIITGVALSTVWRLYSTGTATVSTAVSNIANQFKINASFTPVHTDLGSYLSVLDLSLMIFIIASLVGVFVYSRKR